MDEIGLEVGDGLAEDAVVVFLDFLQLAKAGELRMAVGAIQQQPAMNFLVTLLGVQPVIGCRDQQDMPAESKRLREGLTSQIVGAGMVRRIKIGQDKYFHGTGRIGSFTQMRPDWMTWAMTP